MTRVLLGWAALWLAACAGDVCARAKVLHDAFSQTHQACFHQDALPGAAFNQHTCENSLNACSTADQAVLESYLGCVEKLEPCTPENQGRFNEQVLACAHGMNTLHTGCFVISP